MNFKCSSSGGCSIEADVVDEQWLFKEFWKCPSEFEQDIKNLTSGKLKSFMTKWKINHINEMFYSQCSRNVFVVKDNVFRWAVISNE